MAKKRITELATETTLKDGQYVAIDHTTDGTKKYNIGAELTDLKEDIETLETEVSTLADAVTLSTYNNDKTPYLFRPSGGGKYIGGIEKDSIVGGTVAWNQMLKNGNFADGTSNWSGISATVTVSNGVARTTMTGGAWNNDLRQINATVEANHIYLCSSENRASTPITILYRNPGGQSSSAVPLTTTWSSNSRIFKVTEAQPNGIGITLNGDGSSLSGEWYETKNFNCVDLTQLFGSTIADYIYSLETDTAGSGVAKLKSCGFFTEDYYAYDAGSLKSVEGLEAHITRDADENIIGNYPLDSELTLRGIPKLDSSNNLYYDGDIYRADGSVARNYGIVDLGTLNYTAYTSQGISYFYTSALSSLAKKPSTQFQKANIICKYPTGTLQDLTTLDKYIWLFTNGNLCIKDTAYSDAATFKASLSGVYLVYELATSTTETADPYQNPQLVDKDGTEEYVTTGIVPVGHDTEYYLDADSVLTPPSTTGTYSLKVTVASDGSKSYSWVSD